MEDRSGASTPEVGSSDIRQPRDILFISKATPDDDEFALWLAPRLEAAGYRVFADILSLDGGDRWRSILTGTLQNQAIRLLLCCSNETLAKPGVLEEVDIACELSRTLGEPNFILPLRVRPYKKVFGIAGLQYTDFVRGWAEGLDKLLATLKRQKVPSDPENATINPNWEIYRRRNAITLRQEPEPLTSNWLRITEVPDAINYFEPTGVVDRDALMQACANAHFQAIPMQLGYVSFQSEAEFNRTFGLVGRFERKHAVPVATFVKEGLPPAGIMRHDASNVVHAMLRKAWERYCRDRGLLEYKYSNATGFHAGKAQAPIGQKIPWGRQGERRSSMLRNVARGHVWHFGVSAIPAFWPFPHFKLKSRVLFATATLGADERPVDDGAAPIDDPKRQHRLRRSICKGWRNKQWHGRLRAYIEVLSGREASIGLRLADEAFVRIEASAMLFTSPVSTALPNVQSDEDEEGDDSTLGRPEPEDDE